MRLIRLRLRPQVTKLLTELAKEQGIDDVGFAEDIFSLMRFKSHGLPDKSRIAALSQHVAQKSKVSQIGVSLLMSKRKMILERMIKLPYFKALSRQTDLVLSVRRLMITFRSFYFKVRQSQCISCNLKTKCAFGQQYGAIMTDITKVIDADFSKKVHEDCPNLPQISLINQLDAAIQSMNAMTTPQAQPYTQAAQKTGGVSAVPLAAVQAMANSDPDQAEDTDIDQVDPDSVSDNYVPLRGSGAGKKDGYDNAHTGQHICQVTEQFIQQVTQAQLAIYELGRKFDLALARSQTINFKPVVEVEHDQKQAPITNENEITKLVSSQHGLPEKVFEARLAKKQLVKREYQKPEDKKQLLYLLIDSSNSMSYQLGTSSSWSLFTRASLATVFSLSLARKVRADRGILFLRFFEGAPSSLYSAHDSLDFDSVNAVIAKNNYSGGGTDINLALKTAVKDIKEASAHSELAKAEILLITDCDDRLDQKDLTALLQGKELAVLDVSGGNRSINAPLKAVAKSYYKANESTVDVNKLVTLI